MSISTQVTQEFAYSPDMTFDAVMGVLRSLGLSSVSVDQGLRRVNAVARTKKGDLAVVIHVQPMGLQQRSQLVIASTRTNVRGAIPDDAAEERMRDVLGQSIIQAVSFSLAGAAGVIPVAPKPQPEPDAPPPASSWILASCLGIGFVVLIVALFVRCAEGGMAR